MEHAFSAAIGFAITACLRECSEKRNRAALASNGISGTQHASLRRRSHHHGMPTETNVDLVIQVTPSKRRRSRGKLADVELHFVGRSPLGGMKLMGFSIWERGAAGNLVVKFPARTYGVQGERRSFPLFRPIADATAQDAICDRILDAYAQRVNRPCDTNIEPAGT